MTKTYGRVGPAPEFDFIDYGADDIDIHELIYNLLGRNDELRRRLLLTQQRLKQIEEELRCKKAKN